MLHPITNLRSNKISVANSTEDAVAVTGVSPTVVLRAEMPVVDMSIVILIIVIRVVSGVVASGAVAAVALTAVVPAKVAAPIEEASL